MTCSASEGGHALEHDREGTGPLERERVVAQPLGGVAAALHPAAHHELALRGQADVAHDRHSGGHEQLDLRRDPHAALELHRVGAALLRKRTAVASACSGEAW